MAWKQNLIYWIFHFETATELLQLMQNCSNCSRIVPTAAELFQLQQNCSNCSRIIPRKKISNRQIFCSNLSLKKKNFGNFSSLKSLRLLLETFQSCAVFTPLIPLSHLNWFEAGLGVRVYKFAAVKGVCKLSPQLVSN